MKKRLVLLCSTAVMAVVSLAASAGMTDLADSRLSEVAARDMSLLWEITVMDFPLSMMLLPLKHLAG
jgi:hypothetical protein